MYELMLLGVIFAIAAAVIIVSAAVVIMVCQAMLMVRKVQNGSVSSPIYWRNDERNAA